MSPQGLDFDLTTFTRIKFTEEHGMTSLPSLTLMNPNYFVLSFGLSRIYTVPCEMIPLFTTFVAMKTTATLSGCSYY